jgi:(E)-4-hydroxy-3-methylbut-2-enyl-diphosphate synthase
MAAVEFVALGEPGLRELQGVDQVDQRPNTIMTNRLLSKRIDYPLHLGVTERHALVKPEVGRRARHALSEDRMIRISLDRLAGEEVRSREILKALQLRERGPS